MIRATVKRDEAGRIVSYECSGHAGAGVAGEDIVCAAVSVLAISTLNGLTSLAGITPLVESNEDEGGHLYVELQGNLTQEQMNIAQILLENYRLGLQAVEEEYAEYLRIQPV